MKVIRTMQTAALAVTLTATAAMAQDVAPDAAQSARPIDLAICLDTSGSMDGLIDAARQKIWTIVNDLALAQPAPDLRVALLTFGNNGHDPENGWVHIDTDLTRDLDLVSQRLFALTTNGGDEYVGRVVHRATSQLDWATGENGLKLVIVAGNESADQDPQVSFRDACRSAIGQGVMCNAIYCGDPADELAPAWREVATLSDGHFAAIDKDHGTIVISTPFDDDLTELSATVNATFIAYTPEGQAAKQNQWQQDENAAGLNQSAAAARAVTKGCATIYRCGSWDLVERCQSETEFDLASLDAEQLPEAMRDMNAAERRAYLLGVAAERERIQARITELGRERTAYITQETARQQLDASRSIDFVLRQAIREQARQHGFVFVDATPTGEPEAAPTEFPAVLDLDVPLSPLPKDDGC